MRVCEEQTFGNASSIHGYGRAARVTLEDARAEIARLIHASPAELIFTSGGTESVNFAIKGLLERSTAGRRTIVTALTEHYAVVEAVEYMTHHGYAVRYVKTDEYAQTSVDALRDVLDEDVALVALMHANNEIATVNNIAALAALAHEHGAMFFTDAVQSFGKIPVDVKDLGVDALAFCGHKIYGPKGIGALYVKAGVGIEPLIHGGAQERNRRGGTESVPLAAGFRVAARTAVEDMRDVLVRTAKLKMFFMNALTDAIPQVIFTMHPDDALPHIVSVTFEHAASLEPEAIVPGLDLRGIAASNGAACTSGSLQPSHVLLAAGRSREQALCAVRFSLGRHTTEEELTRAVKALAEIVNTKA